MTDLILLAEIDLMGLLVTLLIGAVCGFLAGQILKGSGFGLIGNIVIGVIGCAIGSFLAGLVNIPGLDSLGPLVKTIIVGTGGGVLLLAVLGFVQKGMK